MWMIAIVESGEVKDEPMVEEDVISGSNTGSNLTE